MHNIVWLTALVVIYIVLFWICAAPKPTPSISTLKTTQHEFPRRATYQPELLAIQQTQVPKPVPVTQTSTTARDSFRIWTENCKKCSELHQRNIQYRSSAVS